MEDIEKLRHHARMVLSVIQYYTNMHDHGELEFEVYLNIYGWCQHEMSLVMNEVTRKIKENLIL